MHYKENDIVFVYGHCTILAFKQKGGTYLGELVYSNDVEYERYKNLCNGDKLLKIVRIEVKSEETNKGVASALMKNMIDTYKKYNIYLLCHPMPRGDCDKHKTTVQDLKRFYGKFGFIPCGELLPTMIRRASNDEEVLETMETPHR